MKKKMFITYNKAGKLKRHFRNSLKEQFPSKKLSNKINLKIYQDYNLPYDSNPDEFGKMCNSNFDKDEKLENLYKQLVKLNPSLKKIKRKYGKKEFHFHVLYGAISKFNVDDIQFFVKLKLGCQSLTDYYDKVMFDTAMIAKISGYGFLPSYKTMKKIRNHFKNK